MTTLKELAAMLDAATGPSRGLNNAVHKALVRAAIYTNSSIWMWRDGSGCVENATSSIDAALALAERLGFYVISLEWDWLVVVHLGHRDEALRSWRRAAPTAPLAILRALVDALIAQENDHD